MKKGIIDKSHTGELLIFYTEYLDNGKKLYQQLPIHPYYRHYLFQLNQEVKFQFAHECRIHYPEYCDCFKKQLYALPILKPDIKSYFAKIVELIKTGIWENIKNRLLRKRK